MRATGTGSGAAARRGGGSNPAGASDRDFLRLRLDSARRAFASDAALAKALGVNASQVARWRKGQHPDPENLDRLVGIDAVVEMLHGVLSDTRIPKWLTGPNANLGGRTPLGVLRQGDLPSVIAAVRVLKSGAYA
jgi:transcriptional regulator with XRE-family HTH domain